MTGKRVVLVDLDLRRPRLASLFGLDAGTGLSSVVLDQVSLEAALNRIEIPGASAPSAGADERSLHVLTAGPLPPDPAEFVETDSVQDILSRLREQFDLVLVDAPPLVGVSESTFIANGADALFVCVRLGVVRKPMMEELNRALGRLEPTVLGQVVTGSEADDFISYYGYGYGQTGDTTVSA
jgi:Mrp family chromosome partitioning ATPase